MLRAMLDRLPSLFGSRLAPPTTPSNSLIPSRTRPPVPARTDKSLRIHIGWTEENGVREPVYVSEADLATHGTILGRTGRGKSKLLQLLVRAFIAGQRGFMVIDPKERAVHDILADIAAHIRRVKCDAILKRVLLIEITPESVPLLSAMHWQGGPLGNDPLARNAMRAFLAKEADVLIEIIHQMAGEPQEGAPRIKRLLRDVFVALATVGLEFGDAIVLLDPFHTHHRKVWAACQECRLLPSEVESDLRMIHDLNRPQDVLTQIEGPLNRLRSLFSPLVRACFTNCLKGIDFARVIRERQIVLVNSSESRFVSQFQAKTVAGFIIHRLIEEAANENKEQQDRRLPFPLLVDEAAELIGPDIERNLRIGRSLKIPTFLFSQNLSAYKRDDKDYRETVLNEPGLTIAFQSKTADELLTNVFLHGKRIDFTKATREVDRPDGYDFVALPSVSRTQSNSRTQSQGGAKSKTNEQTVTEGSGQTTESGSGTSSERRIEVGQSNEVSCGSSASTGFSERNSTTWENSTEYGDSQTKGREVGDGYGVDEFTSETYGKGRTNQDTSGLHESIGNSRSTSSDSILRLSADGHSYERVSGSRDSFDDNRVMERGYSFSMEESSQETTALTRRSNHSESASESQSRSQSQRTGSARQNGIEESETQSCDRRNAQSASLAKSSAQSSQKSLRHAVRRDRQIGRTSGGSISDNWSTAVGISEGNTTGVSLSPLARYRTEIEELPQLNTDIEAQRQKFLTELSTRKVAECFLRNDATSKTIKIRILDIDSPFATSRQYYRAIHAVKAKLKALHGYVIEPDLSPQAEARRIDTFVAKLRAGSHRQDAPPIDCIDPPAVQQDRGNDEDAFG